mmetsp:Transcript_43319/g.74805  ORF Transcript_43319/g.74805 Transcript_43319/m.74805 type:complete len:232 (+) Transcript_43319:330-1025(+)
MYQNTGKYGSFTASALHSLDASSSLLLFADPEYNIIIILCSLKYCQLTMQQEDSCLSGTIGPCSASNFMNSTISSWKEFGFVYCQDWYILWSSGVISTFLCFLSSVKWPISLWLAALMSFLGFSGGSTVLAWMASQSRPSNHPCRMISAVPLAPSRRAGSLSSSRWQKSRETASNLGSLKSGSISRVALSMASLVWPLPPQALASSVRKGHTPATNSYTSAPKLNQSTRWS